MVDDCAASACICCGIFRTHAVFSHAQPLTQHREIQVSLEAFVRLLLDLSSLSISQKSVSSRSCPASECGGHDCGDTTAEGASDDGRDHDDEFVQPMSLLLGRIMAVDRREESLGMSSGGQVSDTRELTAVLALTRTGVRGRCRALGASRGQGADRRVADACVTLLSRVCRRRGEWK